MSLFSHIFAAEVQPNSDFLIHYFVRVLLPVSLINLFLVPIALMYPLAPLVVLFCGALLSYFFLKITSRASNKGMSPTEVKFNVDYPIFLTCLFLVLLPVTGLNYFSTIHLFSGSEMSRNWVWDVIDSNRLYLDFARDLGFYQNLFDEKVWGYISNVKASRALFVLTFNILIGLSSVVALLVASGKIYTAWKTKNYHKSVFDKTLIASVLAFCFLLITLSIFSGYSDTKNFGNSLDQKGFFVNLLIISSAPFIALYQLIACMGILGSMKSKASTAANS